jgi:hexosaminidase
VFTSTPYFHLGCDEVNRSACARRKYCLDYRQRHAIGDDEELYRDFIVRMNEIVKKHGKQTVVWEGFEVGGNI